MLVFLPISNAHYFPEMETPIVLKKFSFNQVKTLANFYKLDWDEFTIYRLFKQVKGNPFLVRLAMCQARVKNFALKH